MRPFNRHRKLLKVLAVLLLFVLYVTTRERLHGHENVLCENGACNVATDASHRVLRKLEPPSAIEFERSGGGGRDNFTILTHAVHPEIVVYNRVPKCASSTVRFLITRLKARNGFSYQVHNWPNVKQSLTTEEEEKLVREVDSFSKPVLFLRHLHFVDFGKHNVTSRPAYVNVIRDPVDRFVSHYYFSRYGFVGWSEEKIKKWLWPMTEQRRNMSLDECVRELGAVKCVHENRENMMDFFCGQDKRCGDRDDWALQRAKENIAKNFVFIGVLEQLEDSFRVAEAILPKYFGGAAEIYRNSPGGGKRTKTARKKEPSAETRRLLSTALRHELELYKFVKRRFEIQLDAVNAGSVLS